MPKNKEYHFYNDVGFDEKIDALSFKKAVKSILFTGLTFGAIYGILLQTT